MSGPEELVTERIARLTVLLGRKPTLQEVFYRDFTATGRWRVEALGKPPRGGSRGGKRVA